jgi:hypothetical protein
MKRNCLDCAAFRLDQQNNFSTCGGVHPPVVNHECAAFHEAPRNTKEKNLTAYNNHSHAMRVSSN